MANKGLKALYHITESSSTAHPIAWSDMQKLLSQFNDGWAVYWQFDQIHIGKVTNGMIEWSNEQVELNQKYLVKLRIFNVDAELHFWRSGPLITGRYRSDTNGDKASTIDTKMKLRGGLATHEALPDSNAVGILTRNYIQYNPDTAQAGYVDSRFVNFIKMH